MVLCQLSDARYNPNGGDIEPGRWSAEDTAPQFQWSHRLEDMPKSSGAERIRKASNSLGFPSGSPRMSNEWWGKKIWPGIRGIGKCSQSLARIVYWLFFEMHETSSYHSSEASHACPSAALVDPLLCKIRTHSHKGHAVNLPRGVENPRLSIGKPIGWYGMIWVMDGNGPTKNLQWTQIDQVVSYHKSSPSAPAGGSVAPSKLTAGKMTKGTNQNRWPMGAHPPKHCWFWHLFWLIQLFKILQCN